MLKIHKKLKIPLLLIIISLGGIFLFQYLTFIPEYSSAESISTITPAKTLADLEYMDEVTPEICGNTPLADTEGNHQYPLKDPRDGQSYTVAKLKDGNCWMTQNMNNPTGKMTYAEIQGGEYKNEYGGYYNWSNAQTACSRIKNWTLPSMTQYNTLTSGISQSSTLMASPYAFQYGGYIYNDRLVSASSGFAVYWSSTMNSANNTPFYQRITNKNIIGIFSGARTTEGQSVRCLTSGNGIIDPPSIDFTHPNISVSIPNILTLEVTDSVTMEDIVANTTNTQEFTATVTSNANYTISLNATTNDTYSTSLVNIKDDHMIGHIDSISSPSITLDPNQWGIKACSSLLASCDNALFQPLPTKDQNPDSINPFFTSTPGSNTHLFQIGINPSSSLPSGTYSTSIQVTASTSD